MEMECCAVFARRKTASKTAILAENVKITSFAPNVLKAATSVIHRGIISINA